MTEEQTLTTINEHITATVLSVTALSLLIMYPDFNSFVKLSKEHFVIKCDEQNIGKLLYKC